jgi:hypothetical protein
MMNRRAAAVLFAALFAANAFAGSMESNKSRPTPASPCTLATLKGSFIYAQDGFIIAGSEASQRTPFAQVGREYFDGAGTMSGVYTASLNGRIVRGRYNGTYTVGADCIATIVFTDNLGVTSHYDGYLADGGDEFAFVQTDSNVVTSAFERRRATTDSK